MSVSLPPGRIGDVQELVGGKHDRGMQTPWEILFDILWTSFSAFVDDVMALVPAACGYAHDPIVGSSFSVLMVDRIL